MPVTDGRFSSTLEIIATISAIISTCSVAHAAANFNQYDEYGFPPNYPAILQGKMPNQKVCEECMEYLIGLNKKTSKAL